MTETGLVEAAELGAAASGRGPLPGEAEYAEARQMPHHSIPTYMEDGEYLALLGKSAAAGYPRALARLGEYALRRGMLVEAHYWFWRARKRGVRGLDAPMREIRRTWQRYGYPSERSNQHELFADADVEAAHALLELTLGRNRAAAQAFLQEHAPDLLPKLNGS